MGFGATQGMATNVVKINDPTFRLAQGRIANSPAITTPTYTLTVA